VSSTSSSAEEDTLQFW